MGTLRIGLTGGLASGKSTVGRWLEEAGIPVMDADQVVAELYAVGAPGALEVQRLFGDDYLLDDGSVNRPQLAHLIFSDSQARDRLEAAIHPMVRRRFEEFATSHRVAVLEATLLVESGLHADCDQIITVEADLALRRQRAIARGMNEEEAQRRLDAQSSGEKRRAVADHILWNDGSVDQLRHRVDKLVLELTRGHEA
jgi:dephospho-CoA kinase